MSLFAEYLKEREGIDTLELEEGFATYQIRGELCYVIDIFVQRAARRSRVGELLADTVSDIARAQGCKTLYGSIAPKFPGATESMKALIWYGFKIAELDDERGLIMLTKEL